MLNCIEKDFVFKSHLSQEFRGFLSSNNIKSILVFPPLPSKLRFLIHSVVNEDFNDTLKSVSIGEGSSRQTIVFHQQMERFSLANVKENPLEDNLSSNLTKSLELSEEKKSKQKRPDMKFYVPPNAKSNKTKSDKSNLINKYHELKEKETIESKQNNDDLDKKGLSSKIEIKQEDEASWEEIYDDDGACVKPEILDAFKTTLKINKAEEIEVKSSKLDYFKIQFCEPNVDDDSKFAHVLEVYDFPSQLRTQDLFSSLSVFNSRDFDIKWVDDTHALVVFATKTAAIEAMKMPYHNIKLRPLSEAVKESKLKAFKCANSLLPYKQRPQTSAFSAHRLVTGALGIKSNITPEQRAAEKKKLQEAKEKRRLVLSQANNIWKGNVR